MSPHMVNGEQLIHLYDRIVDVAANPNCKLFVNSPSELYQIESSYGYNEENNAMHVAYTYLRSRKDKS